MQNWASRFNPADIEGLASLYAPGATKRQVVIEPLPGREAIRETFSTGFGRARTTRIVEFIFADSDRAVPERNGPTGLRGCGFCRVRNGQIVFQRGHFDQRSSSRRPGVPVPENPLRT
ncbi:nuclear transport factor 2 family protein [Alienimonas californiensis]|uniref:nuclear transport factor 2 family protein n=1 Tax=Alienimonas californiensis TaxID=2527989 RepID=UPI00119F4EE8